MVSMSFAFQANYLTLHFDSSKLSQLAFGFVWKFLEIFDLDGRNLDTDCFLKKSMLTIIPAFTIWIAISSD